MTRRQCCVRTLGSIAACTASRRLQAVTVATSQYNNARAGENTSETILTHANVSQVVRLGAYALDGATYGQPLYVPGVTIGGSTYNVLVVATMNNTVYAFDGDTVNSAPLWLINFGATWTGYAPPSTFPLFYGAPIGILSTPVIDVTNGFIYVVTVNNSPTYTLRQINLSTGSQVNSVAISGSVSGSGSGSSGGTLPFIPSWQTQRQALTLANGNVYIGFASINEEDSWHGWVFAYNASTLAQVAILCTTPNGDGGGVWDSAGGFAVDGSGNLYFSTGNGDWDGTANFSQSIVKVNASLVIQDWFTPANESSTSAMDADVASGRVMLIPGTTLLTFASKDARAWVIDTANMGHLQGTGAAPQVFTITAITGVTGTWGGAFFGSNAYFPINGQSIFAFSFSGSTFNTTAISSTKDSFAQTALAGSSNSGTNALLWGVTVGPSAAISPVPLVLHAWDPNTLVELWNSGSSVGNYAKFASPTIANGKVYVATYSNYLVAFGIPNTPAPVSVTGVLVPAQ